MEPTSQNQRKGRETAQWPPEISYFLLSHLIGKHKDGRTGDNGLRKEAWVQIATEVNDRWVTSYDWEQTRNHYRIWKGRLKSLTDLQKDSGMGWNEAERRFCAGQQRWTEMKRKEQRYWKDHPVLPIHLETLLWLGNEIATGNDATHASEQMDESQQVYESAEVPELSPMLDLEEEDEPVYTQEPTSQTEVGSRRRGRPCGGSSSSQKKGKKVGPVGILVDPLRELAAAIKSSSMLSDEIEAAKMVNETVTEMFKNDSFDKKAAATIFLMDHKWAAKTLFSTPKEERVALLEAIMRSTTSTL